MKPGARPSPPPRDIGALGERAAAAWLRRRGYDIVAANYRTRMGEIDLIADDGEFLAFVEVKTRAKDAIALPREAVDARKQARIIKTALFYLAQNPTPRQPRFDVMEITVGRGGDFSSCAVRHLPNAFAPQAGHGIF